MNTKIILWDRNNEIGKGLEIYHYVYLHVHQSPFRVSIDYEFLVQGLKSSYLF